jgi:hypothetical protein
VAKLAGCVQLRAVVEAKLELRWSPRQIGRIREARFPRRKRLADFDFDVAPTVSPATVATLAAGGYLDAPVAFGGSQDVGHRLLGRPTGTPQRQGVLALGSMSLRTESRLS